MRVLIDATPIMDKPSGVGIHVLSLIRALYTLQNQENIQLSICYQPRFKNWLMGNMNYPDCLQDFPSKYLVPVPVRISNLLYSIPNLFSAYLEQRFDPINIIHGTNHYVYPYKNAQKILNIYDMTFLKYPQYVDSVAKNYKNLIEQSLGWTSLIITSTHNTKQDIVENLGVEPNRIFVIPLASRYYPGYLSKEKIRTLEEESNFKHIFAKPYLLFVSTIEPRKNIINLLLAFNLLKKKYKIEHNLILIGQKGWNYKSIFNTIESSPWKSHIYHLGYLSEQLVALFYSKADVFVYPSYYEGFGLPVLEAMTLGCPVITSNTSSLPEVAGDAALLINPQDPNALVNAILKVISDCKLRKELIQKGKERAKLFSWERTAQETLEVYKFLA